jgi:hypothetical protein
MGHGCCSPAAVTMEQNEDFPVGWRVVVACSDAESLHQCTTRLKQLGTIPSATDNLVELARLGDHCDVVVLFSDGFGERGVLSNLRALEDRRAGPALIMVTDRASSLWTPTVERERPSLVISRPSWAMLLGMMEKATAGAQCGAVEPSQPELPFTD